MMPELYAFHEMPRTVKVAFVLTLAGWCWFLFSTYVYYDPGAVNKFLIAGGIICYFLYKVRNWARMIALLSCVFIILYCGLFTFLFAGKDWGAAVTSAVNVALFGAAFYALVIPQTAAYFKEKSPPPGSEPSGKA